MQTWPCLRRLLRNPGTITTGIVCQNDLQDLEFSHTSPTSELGWDLLLTKDKARLSRDPIGRGQSEAAWEGGRGYWTNRSYSGPVCSSETALCETSSAIPLQLAVQRGRPELGHAVRFGGEATKPRNWDTSQAPPAGDLGNCPYPEGSLALEICRAANPFGS
jgi:hypothetical protein